MNPRIGNNFIDANVLDRTGLAEDAAVDTILKMKWDGAFTLLLPYSVIESKLLLRKAAFQPGLLKDAAVRNLPLSH